MKNIVEIKNRIPLLLSAFLFIVVMYFLNSFSILFWMVSFVFWIKYFEITNVIESSLEKYQNIFRCFIAIFTLTILSLLFLKDAEGIQFAFNYYIDIENFDLALNSIIFILVLSWVNTYRPAVVTVEAINWIAVIIFLISLLLKHYVDKEYLELFTPDKFNSGAYFYAKFIIDTVCFYFIYSITVYFHDEKDVYEERVLHSAAVKCIGPIKKADVVDTLHKLSALNKEDLYLHHKDDLDLGKFSSNLSEIESNPFLGYVGKFYFDEQIRICFIGKSGAESRTVQSADLEMNEKFEKFRDSKYSERENAFDDYQNTICSHIEKWKVFKIPELLMEKTCTKNIHNISYVNIVPFRYKGAPSKTVYKIAWENFTQHFIKAINPHFIIPLGKGFDKIITEYYYGNAYVESGIRRTNGDTYIHEEAKKQIDLISSKIKNS